MNCDTWLPNPTEHALALLSNCNDNLESACALARLQALHADDSEDEATFWWWIAVRDSLVPEKCADA